MLLNRLFLEEFHVVQGVAPIADAFDTTLTTPPVNLSKYGKLIFLVLKGVGTTGTSTLTVEACDDTVPSNVSAIPFKYREYITASSDVPGLIKTATASGFATTAGSANYYAIEIDAAALLAAGYKFVRLKGVEVVNSPVVGCVVVLAANPKYQGAAAPATVLA